MAAGTCSGGFENRIWRLTFTPGAPTPIAPAHGLDDGPFKGDAIELADMAPDSADSTYNNGREPLYPTGLAISSDGRALYVANNLGDSLGIVRGPDAVRPELRVLNLRPAARRQQFVYPYDVRVVRGGDGRDTVYVSCWNDAAVVVVDPRRPRVTARIAVGSHPNAMLATADGSRLFVASANTDTVSVIDTKANRELARINVGLGDGTGIGSSPQALALSANERVLFVANAQTQSIAVVSLGEGLFASARRDTDGDDREGVDGGQRAASSDSFPLLATRRRSRWSERSCSSATAKARGFRGRTLPPTRSRRMPSCAAPTRRLCTEAASGASPCRIQRRLAR